MKAAAKSAATSRPRSKRAGGTSSARRKKPPGRCMVVGYDRTESARRAVAWAAGQLPADGTLVLVHACRPLHAPPTPLSSSQDRRLLGEAIIDELLLESDQELLDADMRVEISDHDPVKALTEAAHRHGASGIVVGSERHSRLHRALGTVTTELMQRSAVPVTVVPWLAGAPADDTEKPGG